MLGVLRRLLARCLPSSAAGVASTITCVAALIMVAVALSWYWDEFASGPRLPEFLLTALVFTVLLTTLVYFGFWVWGKPPVRRTYADINSAWKAGIDALSRAGIPIDSLPVFLLLGSSNDQVEHSMAEAMKSCGMSFRVEQVPTEAGVDHALRWYVTNKGIYIYCSNVGALSKLAREWSTTNVDWEEPPSPPSQRLPGQIPRPQFTRGKETLRPKDFSTSAAVSKASEKPATVYVTTVQREDFEQAMSTVNRLEPAVQRQRRLPSDIDVLKATKRLQYLCRLLKHERHPSCGVNGVLTMLPFELTVAGGGDRESLVEVIREDLHSVGATLQLRFPVWTALVGMERVRGFVKFVSLAPEKVKCGRLGKGFEPRQRATRERLHVLSDGVCDAFEDYVYELFRRPTALDEPSDNQELYSLLCRVRRHIKPNLNEVLVKTFAIPSEDSQGSTDALPVFFSGCYVIATGKSGAERAFVKGLLHDKFIPQQKNVEWTRVAYAQDRFMRLLTYFGWVVVFLLIVYLALIIAQSF